MRFARGDMRDHIVSHKNDHGASYWRYGVLRWRSRLKINICEIFGVVRFSTFATISALFGHGLMSDLSPLCSQIQFRSFHAAKTQSRRWMFLAASSVWTAMGAIANCGWSCYAALTA